MMVEAERKNGKRVLKKRSGFMLLELIICIAIIGILAAVAVPNFVGMTDEAKVARIKADLSTIGTAVEMYHIKKGTYPTAVSELVSSDSSSEGYLRSVPERPSGAGEYQINSTTGEVTSTYKSVSYSSFGTSTDTTVS